MRRVPLTTDTVARQRQHAGEVGETKHTNCDLVAWTAAYWHSTIDKVRLCFY